MRLEFLSADRRREHRRGARIGAAFRLRSRHALAANVARSRAQQFDRAAPQRQLDAFDGVDRRRWNGARAQPSGCAAARSSRTRAGEEVSLTHSRRTPRGLAAEPVMGQVARGIDCWRSLSPAYLIVERGSAELHALRSLHAEQALANRKRTVVSVQLRLCAALALPHAAQTCCVSFEKSRPSHWP